MPVASYDDYDDREERLLARKAKLRAKGIVEGSSKWLKLLYRRR
jgi:hypothetical protein